MRAGDNDQRICDRHELKLQKLNLLFYACTFFFSFRVGLNVNVCLNWVGLEPFP